MTETRSTPSDSVPGLVRLGTSVARETAATAQRVIDEMYAGAREVSARARTGAGSQNRKRAAQGDGAGPARVRLGTGGGESAARGRAEPATGRAGKRRSGAAPAGSGEQAEVVEQLIDLVYEVASVLTEAAGRLVEVGAGPLETFMRPGAPDGEQGRLVIEAEPGRKAVGSFSLENTGTTEVTMNLRLINPLASMKGHIPLTAVKLSPARPAIAPGEHEDVQVAVTVPAKAAPGNYFGLVRCDEAPELVLILEVVVT
jgi:hypothetical protein